MSMSIVEIPPGSGNKYRYEYNAETKATIYKGPVGTAPEMGEEEFMAAMVKSPEERYPGLFMDTDKDGIPNVDDTEPLVYGGGWVEEISLAEEMRKILSHRDSYDEDLPKLKSELRGISPDDAEIKGRTKSLYSIINKLQRSHLDKMHDIMAARIVVNDNKELMRVKANVEKKYNQNVLSVWDYYSNPLGGYRAYHYIIEGSDGKMFELQLKTKRLSRLSSLSHTPYKKGALDKAEYGRLSELAVRADMEDSDAMSVFDGYSDEELINMIEK